MTPIHIGLDTEVEQLLGMLGQFAEGLAASHLHSIHLLEDEVDAGRCSR